MTEHSQPAAVSTDEQSDGIPYRELPPETDWKLPAEKINRLQQASIDRLVARCKQAHYVDIVVRINGKYEVHQADWLKHLTVDMPMHGASNVACELTPEMKQVLSHNSRQLESGARSLHASCMRDAERAATEEFGPPIFPGEAPK